MRFAPLPLESRTAPAILAAAGDTAYTPAGPLTPYPGVSVEACRVPDTTGDGIPEIATVPAAGGGPVVRVYDGATLEMRASFFAFDPDLRWGYRIAADRQRIAVGIGDGGGPLVAEFDARTFAETARYWAGDPESRRGVSLSADDFDFAPIALEVAGVPYDLSRLGVRFVGGVDPIAGQWQRLRDSLSLLPPAAFRLLIAGGSSIDVTNGVPITTRPGLAPGTPGLYGPVDGLAGVGDPLVIRLDEQPNGSADYILHEIWHQLDKLLGYPSRSAPWLFRHATTPNWPTAYEATYPAEALAESGARLGRGLPQPDDRIAPFLVALLDGIGV